jgi:hypothetical protein
MLSLIGALAVWVLWSLAPALAADRASFPSDANTQPDSNKQAEDWPVTGPWIVEVQLKKNRMVESEARSKYDTYDEQSRRARPFKMKHSFVDPNDGGLNAVVLEGVSKADLEQMPGVMAVTPDFLFYASAYSWGVDRIDQISLPLDRTYRYAVLCCDVCLLCCVYAVLCVCYAVCLLCCVSAVLCVCCAVCLLCCVSAVLVELRLTLTLTPTLPLTTAPTTADRGWTSMCWTLASTPHTLSSPTETAASQTSGMHTAASPPTPTEMDTARTAPEQWGVRRSVWPAAQTSTA